MIVVQFKRSTNDESMTTTLITLISNMKATLIKRGRFSHHVNKLCPCNMKDDPLKGPTTRLGKDSSD